MPPRIRRKKKRSRFFSVFFFLFCLLCEVGKGALFIRTLKRALRNLIFTSEAWDHSIRVVRGI